MPTELARVVAMGLACPVGLRSGRALAAMNAGITRFVEHDEVWVPGGAARVSMLEGRISPIDRTERAAFFARHALVEALATIDLPPQPLPCLLALPCPGVGPRIDPDAILGQLDGVLTGAGMPARTRLHRAIEAGRAGVFRALQEALALIAAGSAPLVLLCGADSLVDNATLNGLAQRNRLTSRTNLDGIIPGEGAACVLIGHPNVVPQHLTLAHLRVNAVAHEPQPCTSDEGTIHAGMSSARALSAVFRELHTEVGARVDEVFTATSGEVFFAREFAHAYLRNATLMPEPMTEQRLDAALGDVGAASGAISLVHAIARLGPPGPGRRGLPNRLGLAFASSDEGLVGGCVVAAPR